jgi:GDP-L-fucose synthase
MKFDSKVYIAGHHGLVGSAILRNLKKRGYTKLITRTSKELDLRVQARAERFFKKEQPEHVFLSAAKVGGILANNTYKADFIYDNIMIAANVIHSAYNYGVKKLLNLGSSCIYPKFSSQPMKEDYLLTGSLEPTNEPYAVAKISAIKLCRYFNEQYGTNFLSVMPTNLYGPNDNFNLETSHVLPALIRKMYLGNCLQNDDFNTLRKDLQKYPIRNYDVTEINDKEITNLLSGFGIKTGSSSLSPAVEIWGSGKPYREFLYVDDLADACVFLMEHYDYKDVGEFINIGAGKDIEIRDLAELVKDTIGFEGEIQYDLSKPDGTPRKLLDSSRINSLGWKPKTSLEEGIKKTFQWYISSL